MKKQIFILLNLVAMDYLYGSDENNQVNIANNVHVNQAAQDVIDCEILIPARNLNPVVEPASRGRSLSFSAEVELAVQHAAAAQEVPMDEDDSSLLDLLNEVLGLGIEEIADNHSEHNLENFNFPDFSDDEDVLSVHSQDYMDYQNQ